MLVDRQIHLLSPEGIGLCARTGEVDYSSSAALVFPLDMTAPRNSFYLFGLELQRTGNVLKTQKLQTVIKQKIISTT